LLLYAPHFLPGLKFDTFPVIFHSPSTCSKNETQALVNDRFWPEAELGADRYPGRLVSAL
jgi:hypothetical protein